MGVRPTCGSRHNEGNVVPHDLRRVQKLTGHQQRRDKVGGEGSHPGDERRERAVGRPLVRGRPAGLPTGAVDVLVQLGRRGLKVTVENDIP